MLRSWCNRILGGERHFTFAGIKLLDTCGRITCNPPFTHHGAFMSAGTKAVFALHSANPAASRLVHGVFARELPKRKVRLKEINRSCEIISLLPKFITPRLLSAFPVSQLCAKVHISPRLQPCRRAPVVVQLTGGRTTPSLGRQHREAQRKNQRQPGTGNPRGLGTHGTRAPRLRGCWGGGCVAERLHGQTRPG